MGGTLDCSVSSIIRFAGAAMPLKARRAKTGRRTSHALASR